MEPEHRGRVQAQDGDVGEDGVSVSWAQEDPPTASQGHAMLDELRERLGQAARRCREDAFRRAHQHIDRAARAGGIPFSKRSFMVGPRPDRRRVDIEVQKGIAFVPDTSS